jgi:hypothetical protein
MSVFFALDMTIGPRVSTSGPTCRVQKNSHFARCFIQDFFLFKSAISIIFRDNTLKKKINITNVTF